MYNGIASSSYVMPDSDIRRSRFDLSHDLAITCNEGDLFPNLLLEVLPSDTISIDTSMLVRTTTLVAPFYGDVFIDISYFYVPNRIVWEHWEEFLGANEETAWTQPTEYIVPITKAPEGGWQKGTIADAFGIPIGVSNLEVSSLPFRAFALIYNQWYRSENVQDATLIYKGDTAETGSNGDNELTDIIKGGKFPKSGRMRDMFSNCLPSPQKGPDVLLPIGDKAPVLFDSENVSNYLGKNYDSNGYDRVKFVVNGADNKWANNTETQVKEIGLQNNGSPVTYTAANATGLLTANKWLTIDNAFSDLSQAVAVSVNELRSMFGLQKLFERNARFGSRITEFIFGHFGTICPDYRVQRPEYLGGSRTRIDVSSVAQTSATSTTPQGNLSAFSVTSGYNSDFTKSFVEHGMIIGVSTIRVRHLYGQGVPKFFNKRKPTDFYLPVLANIGEQPVYNEEIYAQGTSADKEAFGYLEAWYDYRTGVNRVAGAFRPTYGTSLTPWILSDKYNSLPRLSSDWFKEGQDNIDRVVSVKSNVEDQFRIQFHFNIKAVRPMPIHSTPGLIDHH